MRKVLAFFALYRIALWLWHLRLVLVLAVVPFYIGSVLSLCSNEDLRERQLEQQQSTEIGILDHDGHISNQSEIQSLDDAARYRRLYQCIKTHGNLLGMAVLMVWESQALERYSELLIYALWHMLSEGMQIMNVLSDSLFQLATSTSPISSRQSNLRRREPLRGPQRWRVLLRRSTAAQVEELCTIATAVSHSIRSLGSTVRDCRSPMSFFGGFRQRSKQYVPISTEESPSLSLKFERYLKDMGITDIFCPITQILFVNPVVASDGFTYEFDAISRWIMCNIENCATVSPMTGKPLANRQLIPNQTVKNIISSYKDRFLAEQRNTRICRPRDDASTMPAPILPQRARYTNHQATGANAAADSSPMELHVLVEGSRSQPQSSRAQSAPLLWRSFWRTLSSVQSRTRLTTLLSSRSFWRKLSNVRSQIALPTVLSVSFGRAVDMLPSRFRHV